MNQIYKKYTQKYIAEKCGVCLKTVNNWKKLDSMPYWAIEKMGFNVIDCDLKKLYLNK